jgi:hypothetical protein
MMKSRIAIAISMGIIISVLFTALNMQLGDTPFTYLLLPGYVAIVVLWGPHGGAVPELVSQAVMISVNAVVYGLITFGILTRARS